MTEVLDTNITLNSIETQIFLRESYDKHYGIYNHDINDPKRPYALVELHDAERVTAVSPLYEMLDHFPEKQILKYFGLNLLQFLELPRDVCLKIVECCEKQMTKETNDGKTINQLIADMAKK